MQQLVPKVRPSGQPVTSRGQAYDPKAGFWFLANNSAENGHKAPLYCSCKSASADIPLFGKGQIQGWPYGQGQIKQVRSLLVVRRSSCISGDSGLHCGHKWCFFRFYLNSVGCCRTLPNVAGRSRLDRASTSGLAGYTAMENVLTSGRTYCIGEGMLSDYPEIEYSQQPTASTSEHATQWVRCSAVHLWRQREAAWDGTCGEAPVRQGGCTY